MQGHFLWNAARVLSEYLQRHADVLSRDKDVLELGAGAGLPSFVMATLGAKNVVITDYPDQDLLENLKYNISTTIPLLPSPKPTIAVEGYLWGGSTSHLLSHLSSKTENPLAPSTPAALGFDTLILADLIFNHTEHAKLLQTVQSTLRRSPEARMLVFFSPHRPWLLHKDLAFFELAKEGGLEVEKVVERVMEKAMFEVDRGVSHPFPLFWVAKEGDI